MRYIYDMTFNQAKKLAGSAYRLAAILGVTRQATTIWSRNKRIPPLRVYQLKDLHPEWFEPKAKKSA